MTVAAQPGHGYARWARRRRCRAVPHPVGLGSVRAVRGADGCRQGVGLSNEHDMARISYDEQTAAAFKAVREVPRDGLSEWREAVRRHLRSPQGMTLVDIGAGTGVFAAAFSDWFDLSVLGAVS